MDTTPSIEANAPASPPAKSRRGWKPAIRTQFELPMPPARTAATAIGLSPDETLSNGDLHVV